MNSTVNERLDNDLEFFLYKDADIELNTRDSIKTYRVNILQEHKT